MTTEKFMHIFAKMVKQTQPKPCQSCQNVNGLLDDPRLATMLRRIFAESDVDEIVFNIIHMMSDMAEVGYEEGKKDSEVAYLEFLNSGAKSSEDKQ